ncbi:MAG: hypothetical protein V7K40_33650 [Nostoc sp.]
MNDLCAIPLYPIQTVQESLARYTFGYRQRSYQSQIQGWQKAPGNSSIY